MKDKLDIDRKPGVVYTPEGTAGSMCRAALRLYLRDKPAGALRTLRVFDPAAGTGHFLTAMLDELAALGVERRAAVDSLHGMDIDPDTVKICRARLGGGNIRCGDTLLAGDPGTFDLVIGNPPYIDSETMARVHGAGYRRKIRERYSCARGNWDLYIPFFECGFRLLKPGGYLIYITPDKWLSKPFGLAFRRHYLDKFVSLEAAGRNIFADALVDSVITVMSARGSDTLQVGSRTVDKSDLKEPYALDYLFSPRLEWIRRVEAMPGRLGDFGTCEPACATSDAYKLLPLLREDGRGYRVVNTGTIGKFAPLWGARPMVYLKREFLRPVCGRREFHRVFPHSYSRKARLPKIIIKGLNRLEAMPDFRGEYIPGKTTLIFHSENTDNLLFALGIINSGPVQRYINEKYSGSSYNGAVCFSREMIGSIPVPTGKEFYRNIVRKAREILRNPGSEAAREELDRLVEAIYASDTGPV